MIASHGSSLAPQGHNIRAGPMAHMVNKANTRWLAANLISGHLAHSGNHRHGANQNIPLPNFSHLDYWGCHDLLNALQSNTTYSIIYTDGSDDPNSSNPSGSAAIISLQPNDHTIITSPSPLKGSYPAEIYAIIISLLYPQLTTLPQPIIFAIDNLSTCLTLNTLLHFHSPPFTTSNNSFAL